MLLILTALFLLFLLFLGLGYHSGQFLRRSVNAQNEGEIRVRQCLTEYCENRNAHVLNHITLRLEDGSTTQIDHILISTKGIFVIETKHYSGWIFADSKSKFWTQYIYSIKNRFQNPLFQNYKHVKAVQKLFSFLKPQYIHNIIVFSGEAEFKDNKPRNVFYIEELIHGIEDYPDNILNLNYIQFCIGKLEFERLALTYLTDIEHHASLSERFKYYNK